MSLNHKQDAGGFKLQHRLIIGNIKSGVSPVNFKHKALRRV
jgi:hypothetical protein